MGKNHQYKLFFLLTLLLLFLTFNFMVSVLFGINFIDLGLGNMAENVIVTLFSFVFVILIVYDLLTI